MGPIFSRDPADLASQILESAQKRPDTLKALEQHKIIHPTVGQVQRPGDHLTSNASDDHPHDEKASA